MPPKSLRPRDTEVVDFVVRNNVATNSTLGLTQLQGISPNAVTKVTARMCDQKLLTRYDLIPPEDYFRLGNRAISLLGISRRLAEPLGPQSLPIEFGTLVYATQVNARRRLLTKVELAEYVPWLPHELSQAPYCLDVHGVLSLVVVDLGGSPQHVARKVCRVTITRLEIDEIADLAAQARFQIAVITASDQKAKAILKALQSAQCQDAIQVRLIVIPKLSFLLLRDI